MGKTIKPTDLGAVIGQELEIYHDEVIQEINRAGEEAIQTLVKRTKATAPQRTGAFRRSITRKVIKGERGNIFVWCVKAPYYRLTHLLVHGHAKRGGGRVKGNPFLHNALDEVLPAYEQAIEEAVK